MRRFGAIWRLCRGGWAVIATLVAVLAALAPAGRAQDADAMVAALYAEFDARPLGAAEKRLLQLGLTVEGDYAGLLDGRWGPGSQRALEAFAFRTDPEALVDGLARNFHVVAVARGALDFLVAHDLRFRGDGTHNHRFLAPEGAFAPDPEAPEVGALTLDAGGAGITVLSSGLAFALRLHAHGEREWAGAEASYLVRRDDRLVTAPAGPRDVYLRSDRGPDGLTWLTTLIETAAGADPRLIDVIAASLTLDPTAEIVEPGGRLAALLDVAARLARSRDDAPARAPEASGGAAPWEPEAPGAAAERRGSEAPGVAAAPWGSEAPRAGAPGWEPEAPRVAAPAPPADAGTRSGSGTAFFVNNTDVVTARHVVEGCASVTFVDGAPLEPVALHPTLDLALLSSPRRSRDWIPVHRNGAARLGQRVVALGYPFYGVMSTALTSTGGNVSALSGLRDSPSEITVTAPVQPGNSGGPLLAPDGTVIGVVIATVDKLGVAEATGAIPENINYAVTGAELLAFLETWSVSLPRREAGPVDFDAGVPEQMQRAVVPILCHGAG